MVPVGCPSSCRAQLSGCFKTPQVAHSRTALPLSTHPSHTCGLQRAAWLRNSIFSSVASENSSSSSISSSDADHPTSNSVAATSTSIALRQKMQQLLDGTAEPQQQWRQQQPDGTAEEAAHDSAAGTMPSSGSKARSKGGFGGPGSSSSKTSKKQKSGNQQQAAAISPEAACPCQSGLQYKVRARCRKCLCQHVTAVTATQGSCHQTRQPASQPVGQSVESRLSHSSVLC